MEEWLNLIWNIWKLDSQNDSRCTYRDCRHFTSGKIIKILGFGEMSKETA